MTVTRDGHPFRWCGRLIADLDDARLVQADRQTTKFFMTTCLSPYAPPDMLVMTVAAMESLAEELSQRGLPLQPVAITGA